MYLINSNKPHTQIIISLKNIGSFLKVIGSVGNTQKINSYIVGQKYHNIIIKSNSNRKYLNLFIM